MQKHSAFVSSLFEILKLEDCLGLILSEQEGGYGVVIDVFGLMFEVRQLGEVIVGVIAGREVAGMVFQEVRTEFGGAVENAKGAVPQRQIIEYLSDLDKYKNEQGCTVWTLKLHEGRVEIFAQVLQTDPEGGA